MTPALTTSAAGRAYDYSHVVGGRQTTGMVSMAFGQDDDVYITKKERLFCDVMRIKVGPEPGDEEIVTYFAEANPGVFDGGWPACVAVSPNLNVFVTDELRHLIYEFDRDGKFIRHIGEPGTGPGQFDRPSGIVFADDGSMYVSDTMNHRVQRLSAKGEFQIEWGGLGSAEGQLSSPWGLTVDGIGNVLVADHKNHRIQKFDAEGGFISAIGSFGTGAGEFDHPSDVAVDPDGDIYVCDWANDRVQVFNGAGVYMMKLGGSAVALSKWQERYVQGNPDVQKARRRVDTLEPEFKFALPTAVKFEASRNRLMVVDSQRWRIQIFNKLTDYAEPQFNI
ncbi:MAG: 6-bladed beta-propeller [Chloroflexi bacterium]|nr:6-bladed beta-propeller [Chloroflexota bacterium]